MSETDDRVADMSAMQVREATLLAGAWLTLVLAAAGGVYLAASWQRPHRFALSVLLGVALVSGVVLARVPRERIVRGRYRELFFLSWSVLDLVMVVLATIADGGSASPFALFFLAPVVFAATTYPLASVAAVASLSVCGYLGVAVIVGGQSWSYRALFTVVLLCIGAMSAWQARNHERQRMVLREISRTDPLTGCFNRRGFAERALAEFAAAARARLQCAVIVVDLDDFKAINDRFGHAAGDELLRWVVQAVQAHVRPRDVLGRLGGDEFALCVPDISNAGAYERMAQLIALLSARTPCSAGLALFPDEALTLEELLQRADIRLYESRGARLAVGRSCDPYEQFDHDRPAPAVGRSALDEPALPSAR